jgi:hypothetical protein
VANRILVAPALFLCAGCPYDQIDRTDFAASACKATTDDLVAEIYAAPQGCTAVLEMDADYEIERWALVCGPEEQLMIEASQARRLTECCEEEGTMVNPPDPSDAFVFFDANEAGTGTIAVVSRHTARRVFEASVQGGEPDVRFPAEADWRGPSELAIDCEPEEILDVSSYDEDGDVPPVALVEVLARAKTTGLVDAMRDGEGELLWTIVLRNGAGEPGNGGWVALLQSSSLGIDFTEG